MAWTYEKSPELHGGKVPEKKKPDEGPPRAADADIDKLVERYRDRETRTRTELLRILAAELTKENLVGSYYDFRSLAVAVANEIHPEGLSQWTYEKSGDLSIELPEPLKITAGQVVGAGPLTYTSEAPEDRRIVAFIRETLLKHEEDFPDGVEREVWRLLNTPDEIDAFLTDNLRQVQLDYDFDQMQAKTTEEDQEEAEEEEEPEEEEIGESLFDEEEEEEEETE